MSTLYDDLRNLIAALERESIDYGRVSKIDRARKAVLALDMILVTEAIREVWDTRVNARLGGKNLSVVSKEGLITLKRISGRPQDLADISALTENSDVAS